MCFGTAVLLIYSLSKAQELEKVHSILAEGFHSIIVVGPSRRKSWQHGKKKNLMKSYAGLT